MRATDWTPVERGMLRGFFLLHLPSGLTLQGCSLHRRDGSQWVGLPARPQINAEGHLSRDPTTNKIVYAPVVEIRDRCIRDRFQQAAIAAVRDLARGEP
jgi:hypothetical protein